MFSMGGSVCGLVYDTPSFSVSFGWTSSLPTSWPRDVFRDLPVVFLLFVFSFFSVILNPTSDGDGKEESSQQSP